MIISITAIGGAIGSLIVGPIADKYGRKISIVISDFLFAGGSFWLFMATNVRTLIFGRFIIGVTIYFIFFEIYAFGILVGSWSHLHDNSCIFGRNESKDDQRLNGDVQYNLRDFGVGSLLCF